MNVPRLIFLWIGLALPPWVAAADPVQPAAPAMDATVRELGRQWLERRGETRQRGLELRDLAAQGAAMAGAQ